LRYLDASAIVKLVAPEPESAALLAYLRSEPDVVSSALAKVEVLRAVRRLQHSQRLAQRAEAVLDTIALVAIDDAILARAADQAPTTLRSLDAIHLATALHVREDLDSMIAYDERLAAAAREAGLNVEIPA
jgi:predicted nucleic acid-binding protein